MTNLILLGTTTILFILFVIDRFKMQILERELKKATKYVNFTQDNINFYKEKLLEIAENTDNFDLYKEVIEYSESRRKEITEDLDD